MNIVELNEKNLNDALNVYKKTKARYFEALGKDLPDDKTIEEVARDKLGLVMPGEKIFVDIGN